MSDGDFTSTGLPSEFTTSDKKASTAEKLILWATALAALSSLGYICFMLVAG